MREAVASELLRETYMRGVTAKRPVRWNGAWKLVCGTKAEGCRHAHRPAHRETNDLPAFALRLPGASFGVLSDWPEASYRAIAPKRPGA